MKSIKKLIIKFLIFIFGRPNYIRKLQWLAISKFFINTNNTTCIDIGSGSLYFTEKLKKFNFKRIYAVDLIFDDKTKDRACELDISLIEGDAQKELPIDEGTADFILLSSVLHMVDNPNSLLKECRRLLKKDGILVISTPNEYRFLPYFFSIASNKFLNKIFNLPSRYEDFLELLGNKFGTSFKYGYLKTTEFEKILNENGFNIFNKKYSPKIFGSFLWELSLIFFNRFGSKVFYLLYLLTPVALVVDSIYNSENYSCEHIWGIKKNGF